MRLEGATSVNAIHTNKQRNMGTIRMDCRGRNRSSFIIIHLTGGGLGHH